MKILNNNTRSLIQDLDKDTYVKTEKNADEDKIRFGSGGVERAILDSLLTLKVPFIGKYYASLSSSSANYDVSDKFIIRVSTTGGSITLEGFTGGKTGQIIIFFKATGANFLTLLHNAGTGDEDIVTPDGNNLDLATYGGVILVFNGSKWWVIKQI